MTNARYEEFEDELSEDWDDVQDFEDTNDFFLDQQELEDFTRDNDFTDDYYSDCDPNWH